MRRTIAAALPEPVSGVALSGFQEEVAVLKQWYTVSVEMCLPLFQCFTIIISPNNHIILAYSAQWAVFAFSQFLYVNRLIPSSRCSL